MPNYYPAMLDIRGREVVVIGGDQIAAEKAAGLVACGATVRVLSPTFCDEVLVQAEQGLVRLIQKAYEPGDLAGAFLVVAAVSDPQIAAAIWEETQQGGHLLNVVDMPERCSFILPSILRRGQLTIAVSTEGASPGLAKRIRHRLEGLFPVAYDSYLRLAAAARQRLRAGQVSYARRDEFFGAYFDSAVLAQLETGDLAAAAATTAALLERYGVAVAAAELEEEVRQCMAGSI